MARRAVAAAVLAAALLAPCAGTAAQSGGEILRAEFWTDLDLPPHEGEPYPLPDSVAAARVLEEAAWVFSGMIEGFSFDWTPENKGRQVKERFVLTPTATVMRGDPRLVPGPTKKSSARLGAWIDFVPDASDRLFLESTQSPQWKSAQGTGAASRSLGWAGRREAYAAAARAALESYERSVEAQRPDEITGRLVFSAAPLVGVEENAWVVRARVRIEILKTRRWSLY